MGPHLCSVEGCERRVKAFSLCEAHWRRQKKHGDPLAGPTPKGSLLVWLRDALALSESTDECILDWPGSKNRKGYPQVRWNGRLARAHQVLLEMAGSPRPLGMQVRHLCGRGQDGCLNRRHLCWGTDAENAADRAVHGTERRGEGKPGAKLTEADVRAIRAADGSLRSLGAQYGVNPRVIARIRRRERWAHVE